MESERKYWDQMTVDYRTEKSDDEGFDKLIVHELPWLYVRFCVAYIEHV